MLEVVDKIELLRAVVEGLVPPEVIEVNQSAIDELARSLWDAH